MTNTTRTHRTLSIAVVAIVSIVTLGTGRLLYGQSTTTTALDTVRLTQSVTADGKSLPAGTYQVRLTTTGLSPVVGQSPTESRWVEFVQGDTVVGRAVATVLSADDMRVITNVPMKAGSVRVETLNGGDYLRIWLRHDDSHYLIHLPINGK